MPYSVTKRSHRNGGVVEVGEYDKFAEAEWTAENLKRRDQSGDFSYDTQEIEELSKKTLGSYVKKAATKAANAAYRTGQGVDAEKNLDIGFRRVQGIKKAADKLSK